MSLALEALRVLEWSGIYEVVVVDSDVSSITNYCPNCHGWKPTHTKHCIVDAAIEELEAAAPAVETDTEVEPPKKRKRQAPPEAT